MVYIDNLCIPNLQDAKSWMEVNQTQLIDYTFSIDLDDTVSNFRIKFTVWERDFVVMSDITNNLENNVAHGGELRWSTDLYDFRYQRN